MLRDNVELDYLSEGQARAEVSLRNLFQGNQSGEVPLNDILRALFGENQPVVETDFCPTHDSKRSVKISWQNIGRSFGITAQDQLKLNEGKRYERPFRNTLWHELVHLQEDEKESWYRVLLDEDFECTTRYERHYGLELLQMLSALPSKNGKESDSEWEERKKEQKTSWDLMSKEVDELYSEKTSNGQAYLFKKTEVNARLADLCAFAHEQAGRFPQNKDELWQVLKNCGVSMPLKISEELKAQADPNTPFSKNIVKRPWSTAWNFIDEVNKLDEEKRILFFEKVAPAYYGDFLNAFGHRNGRASMGIPTDEPLPARQFLIAYKKAKTNGDPLTDPSIQELIQRIPNQYLVPIFQSMAEHAPETAKQMLHLRTEDLKQSEAWKFNTPLNTMLSNFFKNFEIANEMLKVGFEINEVEKGLTPESWNMTVLSRSLARVYANNHNEQTRSHYAAVVRWFIQNGADLHLPRYPKNPKDKTTLQEWVEQIHGMPTVEALLDSLYLPVQAQAVSNNDEGIKAPIITAAAERPSVAIPIKVPVVETLAPKSISRR